jgi:hypothetical protein
VERGEYILIFSRLAWELVFARLFPQYGDRGLYANTITKNSAALCQIFDSIFMDVPMSKVKFNVNSEYAYIQNFKVLQSRQFL